MTKKEICKVLEKSGFTYDDDSRNISEVYYHGEMEIWVGEYSTYIYMGSLEGGLSSSLAYRNDELYKFDISEYHTTANTDLLELIIGTNAGESGFYFK